MPALGRHYEQRRSQAERHEEEVVPDCERELNTRQEHGVHGLKAS